MKNQIVALLFIALGCIAFANAQLPSKAVYGIDGANRLVRFSSTNPSNINRWNLQGLASGEVIRGIAFKGSELWGVSSGANRVFQIDYNSHSIKNAKQISGCFLQGSGFGVDFIPGTNNLKVLSNTNGNWNINVNNGFCNPQNPITDYGGDSYSNPRITGAAYGPGNNLYVIDYQNDVLGQIRFGNVFYSIGKLHYDTSVVAGFDIFYYNGNPYAWAALAQSSVSGFFSINLNTGRATLISWLSGSRLSSLAVSDVNPSPPPPPPSTSLCVSAPESSSATAMCPSGTTISIVAAYYGTPRTCPNPSAGSCNSPGATAVVRTQCNGKSSCSVQATNENFGGDPCFGTTKSLVISYTCNRCTKVNEGSSANLSCPSGRTIQISSAYYGTPTNCPSPSAGSCNSGNSLSYVQSQCSGKSSCSVLASNDNFGDPCVGTVKSLAVNYWCK